jgi:hypothetical protein
MQETVRQVHLVVKMLSMLQDGMLDSFAVVEGVLLDLVRHELPRNVLAMLQENSQQIQKQTAVRGLARCHGRVIAVRVLHLRGFQLPSCSSLAKGCALSRYSKDSCEEDERP